MAFRAEFRYRWRSWLAVAILMAVAGGVVLAAISAGRRTESAFPGFVRAHGLDAVVYATRPIPQIATLPDVSSATVALSPDEGQPSCACTHPINPNDFGIIALPRKQTFVKLVSGQMPNPSAPYQVLASYTLQRDEGFHLGSVVRVPFFTPAQANAYNNGPTSMLTPHGPTFAFRVVGFETTQFEFPSGGTPSYDLYTTEAFAHQIVQRVGVDDIYLVRLRHGAADLSRFDANLTSHGVDGYQNVDGQVGSIEASIHPQAIGWWILAGLAALVAAVVVGQALARQSLVEGEQYPILGALGLARRELFLLGMMRNVAIGLLGAVGALGIAILLSPIAPLGEARLAEESTGIAFDPMVLLLGGLGTVGLAVLLGAAPAWRAARRSTVGDRPSASRPSTVVTYLASIGAPPAAEIGVRNALQHRGGEAPVPVASGVVGTVLAVVALCATAVFGASLSHLTSTPRLYGDTFQLNISDDNNGIADPMLLQSLQHNRAITAITEGIAPPEVSINNAAVSVIAGTAIRGPLLLSTVAGHVPDGVRQVGLGSTTMREVGAHVGSLVHVTFVTPSRSKRTLPFRVVSQISFPVLGGGIVGLGTGAAFTIAGYESAECPSGNGQASCQRKAAAGVSGGGLLVSVAAGPRGQAAVDHYLDAYPSQVATGIQPTSLINFGEAVNFPLIFGAILAVFGAATLAHLLTVTIMRRRHEMGLLKALGFVNHQVAASVAWQATTLALIGIVIGVPLGLVVGKLAWIAFANNLGVVPVAVFPVWLIMVLALVIVAAANLIAVVPALLARRSRPADLLRAA